MVVFMTNISVINANSKIDFQSIDVSPNTNIIFILTRELNREKFLKFSIFSKSEAVANKIFQTNVKKLRKEFNNQLDTIAEKISIKWEATRTAESNILVNNFYRNIVMCQTVEDLLIDGLNNLIITDVDELIYVFSKKNHFQRLYQLSFQNIINIYKMTKDILKFCVHFCFSKIISLLFPRVLSDIIIHTFPNLNFKPGEAYDETYFPGVKEFYNSNKKTTSFLLSNTPLNPYKLFKFMNSQDFLVFNEYKFYSFFDLLRAIYWYLELFFLNPKTFSINNHNFLKCFEISHKKYGLDFDVLSTLLRYQLFIKIAKTGYKPELLLLEFEGMIIEKMLIAGLRESKITTKVFGYQHMAVFDNMMCNFFTPYQILNGLLPDKIICSGEIYRDLYAENKIPPEKLHVGPALRYNHIYTLETKVNLENNTILVFLPFNIEDCRFIINTLKQNFVSNRIIFKPHPKSSMNRISSIAKGLDYKIENKSISALLSEYSTVISMNSGALLDAALIGNYVIKLSRPFYIDLDPLFRNTDLRVEVDTPAELLDAINKFPLQSKESRLELDLIKKEYFNPITKVFMEIFLP
jgi:hypothetical protein